MALHTGLGVSLKREEDFSELDLLWSYTRILSEVVNRLLIDQYMGSVQICNFQFCVVA